MADWGKRIRQVANERWDLPDGAAEIMNLMAESVSRAEAGDLGVGEGVLTRSEVTFEAPSTLRFGGCLLYGCKPDATPSNLSSAEPVVYDPTNSNQTMPTVDIAGIAGSTGAIWWSVALVPTDLANRRVWETGYPDGRIQPLQTRQYPRITFQLVPDVADFDTPPADPGTWYRFAAVDWTASPADPTVVLCHALDFGFETRAFDVAAGTVSPYFWLGQVALANRDAATNSGRSYSVARLLTTLALSYLKTLDADLEFDEETGEITTESTTDLTEFATLGVQQLNVAVDGLTSSVDTLQTNMTAAENNITNLQASRVLWFAEFDAAGGVLNQGPSDLIDSIDTGTTGIKKITFITGSAADVTNTSVPMVTIKQAGTAGDLCSAVWNSANVLWVYTYLNNGTLANKACYVTCMGEYG